MKRTNLFRCEIRAYIGLELSLISYYISKMLDDTWLTIPRSFTPEQRRSVGNQSR